MGYYWTLCLIMLLICYASGYNKRKGYGGLLIAIFLLFVFYAFREGFTADYYNYEDVYNWFHGYGLANIEENRDIEMGFQFICAVLPSYRLLIILFTFLFCACAFVAFKYYVDPKYWWFLIIILFCYSQFLNGNMSAMRSGIVTCLFFLSIIIKHKNKISFILAVGILLLAFTVHKSALVLLPLLFIPARPLNKFTLYIIYCVAMVFIYASVFYAQEINAIAMLLSNNLFEEAYLDFFEEDLKTGFSIITFIKLVIKAALLYLTLETTRKEEDSNKSIFIILTAVFYLIYLIPSGVGVGMITRFYTYFVFPCLIGTSYTIERLNNQKKIIYILCIVLCCIWQVYDFYLGPTYKIHGMKYDSIFF